MSAASPSLYRRHRPRTFADLVGQTTVVRTLSHAVQRDSVHHAYLFVGSRGTGKTSMAKILAASLNCERGPTTEPCGRCESCRTIAAATALDVVEMDAASNNSVEDIRELRDSVAFTPVSGHHKVYILDEAHMLSQAAWNALLKTLEEPPPHTIFVLATTEAQKVPPTVVDRCHRFDFQRPTVEQIATVLRRVADAESIEVDGPAVTAIARAAAGSFRDALGTLEQLLVYSGGPRIEQRDVLDVLGVAATEQLDGILDAIAAGDAATVMRALAAAVEGGRDAAALAGDLERRARELMVVQTLATVPPELATTPEADQALAQQAQRIAPETVVRVLDLIATALEAVKAGADSRTQLELALVKAARPAVDPSLRALLERMRRLEAAMGTDVGTAPDLAISPSAPPPSAVAEETPAVPAAEVAPAVPREEGQGAGTVEPSAGSEAAAEIAAPAAAPPPSAAAPAAVQPASATPAHLATDVTLERLVELWPAVVDAIREQHALLAALLEGGRPIALEEADLTVAFAPTAAFLKKKAEDPANRTLVVETLHAVMGHALTVSYTLSDELDTDVVLSEEELLARLRDEFDAEELAPEGQAG